MTKAASIDRSRATATTQSGTRLQRERGDAVTAAAGPPLIDAVPPNATALERALEVSREHLRTALSRIDALETHSLLLKHQVALLQRTARQARQFAYHDELTGLPNRRLLMDRYEQAVALAARRDRRVGLLFLDLDRFKQVNDTHGHAAGDRILQLVAMRLRACIRASDTACRYGGDEFVILLPELDERASAVAAAGKIRARLAVPYNVEGTEITVTASVGVAVYPIDGHRYDDLMRLADGSMYRDKIDHAACRGDPEPGGQRAVEAAASMQTMNVLMKARGPGVPGSGVSIAP